MQPWRMINRISVTVCCWAVVSSGVALAQPAHTLSWDDCRTASTWLFLGDSNTYSGGYVAILDAWIQANAGDQPATPRLLNLGMSSETASGLSEVDHPFKRPCVHERLDKVLAMLKPQLVFICYGMNDGIYQPPSPENLGAYQAGMLLLAKKIKQSGAKLVCLTPPIFEAGPVAAKGKLGPSPEGRFAYFAPFELYDQTLQQQADWCLQNQLQADLVIDIHQLLAQEKATRVAADPSFSFSGDGVHFGDEAHGLIAEHVLRQLHAPSSLLENYPTAMQIAAARKRMQLRRDAYLSATGKNRPGLPAGFPVWYAEQLVERISTAPR